MADGDEPGRFSEPPTGSALDACGQFNIIIAFDALGAWSVSWFVSLMITATSKRVNWSVSIVLGLVVLLGVVGPLIPCKRVDNWICHLTGSLIAFLSRGPGVPELER